MSTPAKHAYRGTMKALQELGLRKGGHIETVDEVAAQLEKEAITPNVSSPLPSPKNYLNDEIIAVDPNLCKKWKFKDRPENELGDIDELSHDLKTNGQIHPAIVRKTEDKATPFEIIIGERRWHAAKKANIKLLVIIKDINDAEAAIIQVSENEKRHTLSEFARGIVLQQQIDAGIITSKVLEERLKKSQSYIRNLLSFSRLKTEIIAAIGDMRNISARTAYDLVRWQEKGKEYVDALIKLGPKLQTGTIGEKQLEKLISNIAQQKQSANFNSREVHSKNGRHLFTWRNDSNKNRSISFPKSIRKYINFEDLEKIMIENIEIQLHHK